MFININIRISSIIVAVIFAASSFFFSSPAFSAPAAAKKAPAVPVAPAKKTPTAPKPAPTAAVQKTRPAEETPETTEETTEEAEEEKEVTDPVDLEIEFMKGLIKFRMPDYAQKALDKLIQKSPDAKARASRIKIDILAGVGKYAEAEALIATMPPDTLETWIMKLSLAEHYYQVSKMTEAKAGYEGFFKKYEKGPPAGMGKFYMDQAYRYAQMLIFKNEEEAAVEAFRCVLLAKPPRDIELKIRIDVAELCIKLAEKAGNEKAVDQNKDSEISNDKEKKAKSTGTKPGAAGSTPVKPDGKTSGQTKRDEFLKKAAEVCEPVMWKDPGGPLFGKALVMMAHIEMIKGDRAAAKKLIKSNMQMLKDLDKVLIDNKISLDFSPMAECRYMLGGILEQEGMEFLNQGKKQEATEALTAALTHFVNVAAKYQTGQWAVPAGDAQDRVVAVMRKNLGVDPQVPPFKKDKIMQHVLKEAQSDFEQNLFKDAGRKYLMFVNYEPEQDTSVAALGELAKCYIEMGDTNYFDAVAGYLAQRFQAHPQWEDNAGNALLRVAAAAEKQNERELSRKSYNYYIKYFSKHKRLATVLFKFGDDKFKEKDYGKAIEYFQQITTQHTNSQVYFAALGKTAYCYSLMKDFSNAVQVLKGTIAVLSPGPDEIETRYRLGDTYRRMDKIVPAINEFVGIINAVKTNKAAYAHSTEEATKVGILMESVYFWKAYCFALLNKGFPPEKLKEYQQKALDDFAGFVKDYPKSVLSPSALIRYGSLLYAAGNSDEANKAFDRLVREYPDAPESKDVVFVQGMSLIEMKKMDKAIEVFGKMLENERAFNASQFLPVGKIMFEEKEYPTAIKFYERAKALAVKDKVIDRRVWEPAVYGLGEAYFAQGNSAGAVKAIEELFAKYQNSPLFLEASFVLSKAYADIGAKENDKVKKEGFFIKANTAMAKGMMVIHPTNNFARFKANLQIADVQILQGEKGKATASYFRMLGPGDWNDMNVRSYMEDALEKGLPLLLERDLNEEVITIASKYLEACPRGPLIKEALKLKNAAKLKMAMSGKKMETEEAPPAVAPAGASDVPAAAVTAPAANTAVQGNEMKAADSAAQPAEKPGGQTTAPAKDK